MTPSQDPPAGFLPGEASASIDDLLRFDEEPPQRRPVRRVGLRWWLLTAVFAGLLTGVTLLALRVPGVRVPALVVFAGFVALLVLRRLVVEVAAPRAPRRGDLRPAGGRDGTDGLVVELRQWENLFERSPGGPPRLTRPGLSRLTEVVDERLRQRHGATRADDPGRARQLLGESLWGLLHGSRSMPRADDVAAHLERLERL